MTHSVGYSPGDKQCRGHRAASPLGNQYVHKYVLSLVIADVLKLYVPAM